jgi:signal transduction histidine kinase
VYAHTVVNTPNEYVVLPEGALETLPRWALVALVVRCGLRFLPSYASDSFEPNEQRMRVSNAIRLAEKRAEAGGEYGFNDSLQLGDQYFDHYDLESLAGALPGTVQAADHTYDDLVADDHVIPHTNITISQYTGMILAVSVLAMLAFRAAFSAGADGVALQIASPADTPDLLQIAKDAVKQSELGHEAVVPQILWDIQKIGEVAKARLWTDLSPVKSDDFGPLWRGGAPPGWPSAQLTFKPRARIIRTIGDRLISGPEAAVIELIKNSHDADASFVRITFTPPLQEGEGEIIIDDDGHGMSLDDIEQRWMEPATSDKRDRRSSPLGRKLLGSKGIGRFASARLGRYLSLTSSALLTDDEPDRESTVQSTRIPKLDWNAFENAKYLEDVHFSIEILAPQPHTGTSLRISGLRDAWPEMRMAALHSELRRVVSPIRVPGAKPFRIFLDLSACTKDSCGYDGSSIVNVGGPTPLEELMIPEALEAKHEVRPFPILDSCDYEVEGLFDESGVFSGAMTIRRAGQEPESISLSVPLRQQEGEENCGIVLVRLYIFDRDADAVKSTAQRAGFGRLGLREARRLLDSIAGVSIFRGGFRIRPYGDDTNDWLTLDSKRVQNPTIRIGRNQIAGFVSIDDEGSSNLVERSSREGLEENGSFRRLRDLISTLLAEQVEPRRRAFRISAGFEEKESLSFKDVYQRLQLGWSKLLLAKIPEPDREEAEALVSRESDRLTAYVKRLEERQAQLEARVTLGLIIGELLHQGNTPLSFLETESERLNRWWPGLMQSTRLAEQNREDVPHILRGMISSSQKLRVLFKALSPLSGARRGKPVRYDPVTTIEQTHYLFRSRMEAVGIAYSFQYLSTCEVFGYSDDLATAMTNLLENAVYWLEHRPPEAPEIRVTVDLNPVDERCLIVVADNGPGIPAEFVEQIFDIGFTLKPNGTGLGLSIAKEAIQRSNGELKLLEGHTGTAFQLSMPTGQ